MLYQRLQWAGLLRMAALSSAAQRSNAVACSALHRYWRGDLQHLVAVVGRAVQKTHEHWRAGYLGQGHDPWQQPGPAAEEGNLDTTSPVAAKRRRVDRDRHDLIGAERGRRQRRDLQSARPWLDVRPLLVTPQRPGVDAVPEPPLGG